MRGFGSQLRGGRTLEGVCHLLAARVAGHDELRSPAPVLLVDDPVASTAAGDEANLLLVPPDSQEQSLVRAAPRLDHETKGFLERNVPGHAIRSTASMYRWPLTFCPAPPGR